MAKQTNRAAAEQEQAANNAACSWYEREIRKQPLFVLQEVKLEVSYSLVSSWPDYEGENLTTVFSGLTLNQAHQLQKHFYASRCTDLGSNEFIPLQHKDVTKTVSEHCELYILADVKEITS